MLRKPKFKPEIRRVRLNPEQAVLLCACHNAGGHASGSSHFTGSNHHGCQSAGNPRWVGNYPKCSVIGGAQWGGNLAGSSNSS